MEIIGERVAHAWACVFLDGRWVSADATFDKPLLDFALDDHWQMQDSLGWGSGCHAPGASSDRRVVGTTPALWGPAELPEPTPEQTLRVLNQRLAAIRAEMEARMLARCSPRDTQLESPRKRGSRRRTQRRRFWRLLFEVVALVGLLGVVLVLPWRWIAPPTTAFMARERIDAGQAGNATVYHRWLSWQEISPHLAIAVVAAEDQKFPSHHGFDFESISKAVQDRSSRPRGASTISQQVAKNLFLWRERSFLRKGLEACLTVLIEGLWPKRRILEVYLNVAEFGPGVFGAGAASELLLGKPSGGAARSRTRRCWRRCCRAPGGCRRSIPPITFASAPPRSRRRFATSAGLAIWSIFDPNPTDTLRLQGDGRRRRASRGESASAAT